MIDLDNDDDIDFADTFVTLQATGIPAEPRIIITDPDAPTLCIGTECTDTIMSANDDSLLQKILGQISGTQSSLNQVFSHSWSTDIEPASE